jgi:hypothetical protein
MMRQQSDPIFACNAQAIPPELRPVHAANTQRLVASIQEVRELPTGYALRLPNETDVLQTACSFISYERLCCPFFHFQLEIEPEQGPVWFRLTGTTDIKPFIQSEGLISSDISSNE